VAELILFPTSFQSLVAFQSTARQTFDDTAALDCTSSCQAWDFNSSPPCGQRPAAFPTEEEFTSEKLSQASQPHPPTIQREIIPSPLPSSLQRHGRSPCADRTRCERLSIYRAGMEHLVSQQRSVPLRARHHPGGPGSPHFGRRYQILERESEKSLLRRFILLTR